MEYVIHLRWLGLHGDIVLERAGGELLYVLKASRRWHRHWPVLDAGGNEVFHVCYLTRVVGRACQIRSGRCAVGEAGSKRLMSEGYVNVADLPMVYCKYNWWGMSPLELLTAAEERHVGTLTSRPGLSMRYALHLHDEAFDQPPFLVGCALLVRDYTSRG